MGYTSLKINGEDDNEGDGGMVRYGEYVLDLFKGPVLVEEL